MILRGHHLFCTALYGGHGYSETFCRGMEEVLRRAGAGEPVTLAVGEDAVCESCPHRLEGGGCALGTENVALRDENALAVLGLRAGEAVTWEETRPLLYRVTEEDFRRVCGGCRWYRKGLCSAGLLREKTRTSRKDP